MSLKRTISNNLKAERIKRGWTQEELAARAGLHHQYVALLEREPKNIGIDVLEKLSKALKLHPSTLLAASGTQQNLKSDLASELEEAQNIIASVKQKLKAD